LRELSVIIVNHNSLSCMVKTLSSLSRNLYPLDHEVIVVDNASSDGSVEIIRREFPSVKLIALPENVGFAKANNQGAKQASGHFLLLLNSDTSVPAGTVEKLIEIKKSHPDIGIVAPLVFYPDESLQISWGKDLHLISEVFLKYFAKKWYGWQFKRKKGKMNRNVDWVSGACFLIELRLYKQVRGFDEKFFLYIEDADLGRRIRQLGHKIHLTSEARIIHYKGEAVSKYPGRFLHEAKKSQMYYYGKHNGRFSAALLRSYLLLRFHIKHFFSRWQGNLQNQEIYANVISTIKEIHFENPT
jgi:GT2 family glycosyltransferase